MKRMFFAMMLGILVFPGFSFNANADERGLLRGHNGVAFGLNLVIGGGFPSHSSVFLPHNPRILVVPGGVYFLGSHHRLSYPHFDRGHHGPWIWVDAEGPFFSHHKRSSYAHFDRGAP